MSWDLPHFPPVTEADRLAIAEHLGLQSFSFLYTEKVGKEFLRAVVYGPGGAEALLNPDAADSHLPRLERQHPGSLAERAPFAADNLAQVLLPFPLRLWFETRPAEASGSLTCSDPQWARSLGELGQAIQALETALQRTEISVLELTSEGREPIRLFFHCVRKRFLVLGRLPEALADKEALRRLGASFQWIQLSPAAFSTFSGQVLELRQVLETLSQPAKAASADPLPL
ncbi:hypothetical protein K2X33_08055 [bacterium]|nr:hypothetical protein [bacterium]